MNSPNWHRLQEAQSAVRSHVHDSSLKRKRENDNRAVNEPNWDRLEQQQSAVRSHVATNVPKWHRLHQVQTAVRSHVLDSSWNRQREASKRAIELLYNIDLREPSAKTRKLETTDSTCVPAKTLSLERRSDDSPQRGLASVLATQGTASRSLYRPLEFFHIRLLRFETAKSQARGGIHLSIHAFEKKAAPRYEALSYRWGNPRDQLIVVINDSPFRITRNLYLALGYLSKLPEADRPYMWIDAICINQEDLEERAHQVLLMREIYHVASRVVIWLGEPSSGNEDELGCILELKQYINSPSIVAMSSKHHGYMLTGPVREPLVRFVQLLGNEYFSRLWMVTEVMAAQDAIIRLGAFSVAWSDFLMVCQRIHGVRRNSSIPEAFLTNLRRAQSMLSKQPDFSLTHLLARFRGLQCSDDRDRVFALLTTSREVQQRYHYLPDYNLSTSEVYADIIKFIIRETKSLDVLACNQAPGYSRVLPSWAVDWTRDWSAHVLEPQFSKPRLQHAFQACGGLDAEMLDSKKDQLVLKGSSVDSIASTYEPSRDVIEALGKDVEKSLATILDRLIASLTAPETSAQAMQSDLFRTLAVDAVMLQTTSSEASDSSSISFTPRALGWCTSPPVKFDPDEDATTDEIVRKIQPQILQVYDSGFRGNSEPLSIDLSPPRSPIPPIQLEQSLNNDSPPVAEADTQHKPPTVCPESVIAWILAFCQGRKLLLTQKGHLGLGPAFAQPGDEVCVLLGADVPFVLRPVKPVDHQEGRKYHHVVGECYLHGFMDGEAIDLKAKGGDNRVDGAYEVFTLI